VPALKPQAKFLDQKKTPSHFGKGEQRPHFARGVKTKRNSGAIRPPPGEGNAARKEKRVRLTNGMINMIKDEMPENITRSKGRVDSLRP